MLSIAVFAAFACSTLAASDAAWARYDFIPGARVLYFEDFAKTDKKSPLGRLQKPSTRLDLQERDGRKWLHCRPPCTFEIVLPQKLPERFTIDFDLLNPVGKSGQGRNGICFSAVNPDGSAIAQAPIVTSSADTLAYGNGGDHDVSIEMAGDAKVDGNQSLHFSWAIDGAKAKGYVEQTNALNVPDLSMPRTALLHFEFVGGDDPDLIHLNSEVWLTNLRIAAGGPPAIFEELSARGRVALQGILFDTGSDRIRPESTPTLLAIARVLTEHPELNLTVEGHTDNQGKAGANLTLSDKRAAAVRAWIVNRHKIEADRLETKGFGQTRPVGSNDTSEGRQANRRVELVKR